MVALPLNIAWILAGSSGMAAFDNISNSEFGVAMTLTFAVYVAKAVYSVYFTEGEILWLVQRLLQVLLTRKQEKQIYDTIAL